MIALPSLATLKLAGAAAIGIIVAGGPIYLYGRHTGAADTRAAIEAKAAREAFDRIQTMEKTDEDFRRMPARERCLAFMRDSGLPDNACD